MIRVPQSWFAPKLTAEEASSGATGAAPDSTGTGVDFIVLFGGAGAASSSVLMRWTRQRGVADAPTQASASLVKACTRKFEKLVSGKNDLSPLHSMPRIRARPVCVLSQVRHKDHTPWRCDCCTGNNQGEKFWWFDQSRVKLNRRSFPQLLFSCTWPGRTWKYLSRAPALLC